MSFVGFVLAFCSFPMLTEAGVYSHTSTDNFIIYTVSVNTWLSLTSSVLGFFVISSLLYTKLAISDLIFCGLSVNLSSLFRGLLHLLYALIFTSVLLFLLLSDFPLDWFHVFIHRHGFENRISREWYIPSHISKGSLFPVSLPFSSRQFSMEEMIGNMEGII